MGEKLPDYTDTRWSSACDASEQHATFLLAKLKWVHAEATCKEEKQIDRDQATYHKTVLDKATAVLQK